LLLVHSVLLDEEHLSEDTTQTPHIEFVIIEFLSENDLWWSVPSTAHMVAQALSVLSNVVALARLLAFALGFFVINHVDVSIGIVWRDVRAPSGRGSRILGHFTIWEILQDSSGLTKVAELNLALVVDQEVGGLNVSVHDVG